MEQTRQRWVVAVNDEIRYTTETDQRSEAKTWADHNLPKDQDFEIISTTPELDNFTNAYRF